MRSDYIRQHEDRFSFGFKELADLVDFSLDENVDSRTSAVAESNPNDFAGGPMSRAADSKSSSSVSTMNLVLKGGGQDLGIRMFKAKLENMGTVWADVSKKDGQRWREVGIDQQFH